LRVSSCLAGLLAVGGAKKKEMQTLREDLVANEPTTTREFLALCAGALCLSYTSNLSQLDIKSL